jgi:predicted molibdopterin-dependent oxidoreductase YjgC
MRTTCPYCGVGCQVEPEIRQGRVVRVLAPDIPPNHGALCVKVRGCRKRVVSLKGDP